MSNGSISLPTLGMIGFGAFGRLAARHLCAHFRILAYDPAMAAPYGRVAEGVTGADLAAVAGCPIVVIATPVDRMAEVVAAIAPLLRPGALVLDVGSVKTLPAAIMAEGLPETVDIVATHPLFGPESAAGGLTGLNIAVCPIRGRRAGRVAAFFRRALGLRVIVTTPQAHDREAAIVQGLTHLIAKVLVQMEPLPTRMTTRSFELLVEAAEMVRNDAPGVFEAIERANPFAAGIRRRFFDLAAALDARLERTSEVDAAASADRPTAGRPAAPEAPAADDAYGRSQ